MFADALNFTHNGTGGSGTLTVAARTGFPQPSDVWGTSLTKYVNYNIAEYTDSTFATLSKYERGIGSIDLSTSILTRTSVRASWTSGGSYNCANPTALTFGNTAANIIITFTATANAIRPGIPGNIAQVDTYHYFNSHQQWDSGSAFITMANGTALWSLCEYSSDIPITTVAVNIGTGAGTGLRVGFYDINPTTGFPKNLISEPTSTTQFNPATSGFKSVTPATPLWLPNGWYWVVWLANGAPTLAALTSQGYPGMNSSGSRDYMWFNSAVTYGALPATGPTTWGAALSRSSGNPPWLGYK